MKFDFHHIPKPVPGARTSAVQSDSNAVIRSLLRAFGLGVVVSGRGLAALSGVAVVAGPWWANRGTVAFEETVIAANGPLADLPSVSAAPPYSAEQARRETIAPLP